MAQVTYLQLSPEFGGTRFGPFRGVEIRLGSDPEVNDISLPADLGVAPQHLKVLQQGEATFIIAPVDRTASVYIWRKNSSKPKQIVTPMAVTPGDSFSLVVPEGARFTIEVGMLTRDKEKAGDGMAEKAMKRMPTSRGLLDEIKRRGFAVVFTTKLGNAAMNISRFVITGQIFSPVYIIAGLMMVSGWFFAGGAGCGLMSLNSSKNDYADKWRSCQDEVSGLDPDDGEVETVPTLTKQILGDNQWKGTLVDDPTLSRAYRKQLVNKFNRKDQFAWVYRRKSGKFATFKRSLRRMPDTLTGTLAFVAAQPSQTGAREWAVIEDSEGEDVCGRGPLRLTYRQAIRLGLENVQLDRLVNKREAASADTAMKRDLLLKTAEFEGVDEIPSLDGTAIAVAGGVLEQGGRECMHLDGPDDRTDMGAVSAAIRKHLGATAPGLPPEGASYWVGNRLAKLAAMDFAYDYDKIDFTVSNQGPIANLEASQVSTQRINFAGRYVADAMTNAVVAKCGAVLDKDLDSPPEHLGKLPSLRNCLYIKGFVDYGRL